MSSNRKFRYQTKYCPLCNLLSCAYSGVMRVRNFLYQKGISKSYKVSVPVICVGNITTGGTGKTPMVAWVVNQLKLLGKSPAILTRGYKAVDGKSDEAELLKKLTSVPVIMNPDRVAGAKNAIVQGADILVMDDGFQHMRLKRDADIILLDSTNPFGYRKMLPAGRLREPMKGLSRAAAFVATRSDQSTEENINSFLAYAKKFAPNAPTAKASHYPTKLISLTGEQLNLEEIRNKKVLAFCALGNPAGFYNTLEHLGAKLVDHVEFADHADYSEKMLNKILDRAKQLNADFIITTQKDAIKIPTNFSGSKIYQLAIEMKILQGQAELISLLKKIANF